MSFGIILCIVLELDFALNLELKLIEAHRVYSDFPKSLESASDY